MRCKAWLHITKTKTGREHIAQAFQLEDREPQQRVEILAGLGLTQAQLVPCGGTIEVDIDAIDMPDWGDHYAELSIRLKCSRCGMTFHPYLPNNTCLEEFLEVLIRTAPDNLIEETLRQAKIEAGY